MGLQVIVARHDTAEFKNLSRIIPTAKFLFQCQPQFSIAVFRTGKMEGVAFTPGQVEEHASLVGDSASIAFFKADVHVQRGGVQRVHQRDTGNIH
ncbi:hypothetical protein D3C79_961270 [compost metagenome]